MNPLADLSPSARRIYFRLRNNAMGNPERKCSCCGETIRLTNIDYVRSIARSKDDGALMELLVARALVGAYDDEGNVRGLAIVVDFGTDSEVERNPSGF